MPEIIDCQQGTEDWIRARMGMPTASEFKTIIGIKKDAREKLTRATYMRKLAGEIITGEPMESYTNANMERGKIMEDDLRSLYAFAHEVEPQQVGFITNGKAGWSPDSLIGASRALEIKSAFPHVLIEFIERDDFPSVHKAQCQGGLWVGEIESIDLVIGWPGMPLFEKRAFRDEPYIANLAAEVDRFNDELAALVHRIRCYGHPPTLVRDLRASLEVA